MIQGRVTSRQARILLQIHGSTSQSQDIEAIIDTGFNGFLTLGKRLIANLGLARIGRTRAILADGTEQLLDLYEVTVIWDGKPRTIEVDATNTDPLVGMSLLEGHDLTMSVREGGYVVITETLPS
ncbi:MAG: clan AA aspartic protease [Acidobacteriota bacterium]